MPRAWYIDALDALAGRAFASWRAANLLDAEDVDDFERPFFVEPPDFQPQPLGGASVGLAATRGSFQMGFFIAEQEVPFPSAAAVSEFVRRAYISGGGGAAPGGGGLPLPPPRPEEGPRGEPPGTFFRTADREADDVVLGLAEEGEYLFARLVSSTFAHAEIASGLRIGHVATPRWEAPAVEPSPSPPASVPSDRLARAGGALLLELLDRFPGLSSTPQQFDEWSRWLASARALFALCDRLRIFDWLQVDRYGSSLASDILSAALQRNATLQEDETIRLLSTELPQAIWLFHPGFVWPSPWETVRHSFARRMEEALYGHPAWAAPLVRLHHGHDFSVPEDLHRITVPRWLAAGMDFGPQARDDADLMNFLMLATGQPDSLAHPAENIRAARAELLLLIASAIVSQPQPRRHRYAGTSSLSGWIRRDVVAWYHVELAVEALVWLERNSPKLVFAKPVEEALAATRALAYA